MKRDHGMPIDDIPEDNVHDPFLREHDSGTGFDEGHDLEVTRYGYL